MYSSNENSPTMHGTTILCIKKDNEVIIAADGQVSLGPTIMKSSARKLRTLADNSIVAGFAGSTADAFTLFERLEAKLEKHSNQLLRACVELAKDWRTDKYLRRLEAMLIVADRKNILILTGTGDVLEPEDNIAAIGSGGNFARSAAAALIDIDGISAEEIVRKSMKIAADICVYSNQNIIIEKVK
ncbi:MAG: hslV [Rickettsiaceae bacterium]|jgi:ATP-dependent HslUV protease subunit HslV|nr:hslV [Rickettsiaceae bacterium]